MSRRRTAFVVVVVVAVATAAAFALAGRGEAIPTVRAARGDLVVGIDVAGTLASEGSSQLGPPAVAEMWDFKLTWMAPEGSTVEAGEPVLRFDTTDLERRLREKRNEAEQAGKELEKLDRDLERTRLDDELARAEAEARERKARLAVDRPGELAAAVELERARLELREAELELDYLDAKMASARRAGQARRAVLVGQRERALRQVEETEQAIAGMTVVAPRRGTVIYVTDWRDEKKKVGDSVWRHEKVVELPDLERMMGQGEVDEADGGRVVEGQSVRFRLDAHPDVEYRARVGSVWKTVRRRSWRTPEKVFRLDLVLESTDGDRMRPGMRLRGTIEVERVSSAVLVPLDAVFPGPDGPIVHRRSALGFEVVPVRLGERNAGEVVVLEGVEPGDRLAARDPRAEVS